MSKRQDNRRTRSTSQAGTRLHKPMPPSTRPCLKCASRDHESGKCPKNQEHRSHMAHAMNFTAWWLGSDEMNTTGVTSEVFIFENLARGRVLLDWRGSDRGAVINKAQEAFGTDHDWVSVDTNDRPVYKFGDAKRKQALSKVKVKVQPGGHVAHLHVHAQETEGVPVLLLAKVTHCNVSSHQLRDGSCDLLLVAP